MINSSIRFPRSFLSPKFRQRYCFVEAKCPFSTENLAVNVETKERHNPHNVAPKERIKYKEPVNINKAVDMVKELAWAKFDETVEISVNLGLDPRKPNQSVKGVAQLPHGNGKKIRIAVFATGKEAIEALEAGADVVGSDDLVAMIQAGDVNFDTVIATPAMMSTVGKIGRIIGPRGLMPSPKMGTVTNNVMQAVKAAKAGAVRFKVERKGIVQAGIGKVSFSREALLDNIRAFMIAVFDVKPEGMKGKYLKVAHICSSMGPSITLEVPSVDPSSARFMLNLKVDK
jgi:large subunit ribosomal protein L1